MADITWQRSERPDGHRSLWFHAAWLRKITDAPGVEPSVRWDGGCVVPDGGLPGACAARACPTPTAEDLAWLRGEG